MTVRLRPHHLLCLLTYVGEGYSPAFTVNLTAIAQRLAAGEDILIVDGPDDVCTPLLNDAAPHCHLDSVLERDRIAARDIAALLARPVRAGQRIIFNAEVLSAIRDAFTHNRIRAACTGCQWNHLCNAVVANGYRGTVFLP